MTDTYIKESKAVTAAIITLMIGMVIIMVGVAVGTWQREILRNEMQEFHRGRTEAIAQIEAKIMEVKTLIEELHNGE